MSRTRKVDLYEGGSAALPLPDSQPGNENENVGWRLRVMRSRHRLTVTRLAELSGVPASTISKIENGRLRPSLVNAINLAQALGENLGFLIGRYRAPERSEVVVRAAKRQTISYEDMGIILQDLSGAFPAGMLEARVGILSPDATSGKRHMNHAGEEFCYVVAGDLRYEVEGREFLLSANDYIQLKSETPHSWKCVSKQGATVIWVFSDGPSF